MALLKSEAALLAKRGPHVQRGNTAMGFILRLRLLEQSHDDSNA
jgi:hypothetical protein